MSSRHLIGRRQFLITSSACAVATAVLGPKVFAGENGAPPRRLAIGFADYEEHSVLRPAADLVTGDGAFIGRGARVSVSGASGVSSLPEDRRVVELLTHFSYLDGSERKDAPFRAWACRRTSQCQGSPVSFTVPVDEVQEIVFSVGTERGKADQNIPRGAAVPEASDEAVALPVRLSVQSGDGLKLARGFYVIVPLYDNDSEPRWSSYELKKHDGRWALHDDDGKVAPFEHFVLRIDYAS